MPDMLPEREAYDGRTYYGRAQLKPAPFENAVVGGYIFLAGLSGAAQLLGTVADLAVGRRAERVSKAGRALALLAPMLGAPLLIYDLHTPKRFYNMLRIFRATSPMSIGTWVLMAFSGFSVLTAALDFAGRRFRLPWTRAAARVTQLPAAVAGAGLATYTAGLLSATSTPLWAAAPRALAVRFGASSIASGAAALTLGEGGARSRMTARLDALMVMALAVEFAAGLTVRRTAAARGVSAATGSRQAVLERAGSEGLGIALPVALKAASAALGDGRLSTLGSLAVLGGGLAMRIGVLAAGDESARRPADSFRFASGEGRR